MNPQRISVEKQSLPLARSEDDALKDVVKTNQLIFVGALLELGPQPNDWSGYASAFQNARYKIVRIMKGAYGASEISVNHIVVYGSKTAQAGETPGLSSSLFSPNNELIVFAKKTESGQWKDTDEILGTLPATDQWVRKVEIALSAK
jgi:hypothetical protein